MEIPYTFPHVPALKNLNLVFRNNDGRLSFKATGPWSLVMGPLLGRYVDMYNRQVPITQLDGGNVYTLYVPPIPSKAHSREIENLLQRWVFRKRIPLAVTIAVTRRCQCRCAHCSLSSRSREEGELTIEEIKRVVGECIELGVTNITFTGGEPLLRDDLEDLIRTVPKDKAVVLVFTNGLKLTPNRLKSLKTAGISGVQISLDSPDPDEHDSLRGKAGIFRTVQQGAKTARRMGLLVGLSTYATNEFIQKGKFGRIAALGAQWGVHEITVFDAIPAGRMCDHTNWVLTARNREHLMDETDRLRRMYRGKLHIITQAWTNSHRGFARIIGCLAGHYQFHISATGEFRPCDFTPVSLGNVREKSVGELWRLLASHPAYHRHRHDCRMQSATFRREVIEPWLDRETKEAL